MIPLWKWIRSIYHEESYIWVNVILIRETPKAMLIIFDGRKAWIPKAWILSCKQYKDRLIKIKISESHWANKFI